MTTRRERAREKYQQRYGHAPATDIQLNNFIAMLPASEFQGCSDSDSSNTSSSPSYDTTPSPSSSSDSGGGYSDSGGGFSGGGDGGGGF